jgi:hypothetical protein
MSEEKPANRQRDRIRTLLARHDPGFLAFMDATRGVFGEGVRATQLHLRTEDGRVLDLRPRKARKPR